MQMDGKQIKSGSVPASALAPGVLSGKPSTANKGMTALVTTTDGSSACTTGIASAPIGHVQIEVNGLAQNLGDGVKTADAYFSGDTGTTARAISAIVAGDLLYWNGSVAGFQLAATDSVSFLYNA